MRMNSIKMQVFSSPSLSHSCSLSHVRSNNKLNMIRTTRGKDQRSDSILTQQFSPGTVERMNIISWSSSIVAFRSKGTYHTSDWLFAHDPFSLTRRREEKIDRIFIFLIHPIDDTRDWVNIFCWKPNCFQLFFYVMKVEFFFSSVNIRYGCIKALETIQINIASEWVWRLLRWFSRSAHASPLKHWVSEMQWIFRSITLCTDCNTNPCNLGGYFSTQRGYTCSQLNTDAVCICPNGGYEINQPCRMSKLDDQ